MLELISQGAEARVYSGDYNGRPIIVKERFSKSYRHQLLDERLTKERLRAELRGIQRARSIGVRTPSVYFVDSKTSSVYMEKLENVETVNVTIGKLKNCGDGDGTTQELKSIGYEVGIIIGKLHHNDIIHGDLTTSNILVEINSSPCRLIFIDFGLSHVDESAEDKGVDLYVLERALASTHSTIPWIFDSVLEGYGTTNLKDGPIVVKKLDEIRLRGRKRTMVG